MRSARHLAPCLALLGAIACTYVSKSPPPQPEPAETQGPTTVATQPTQPEPAKSQAPDTVATQPTKGKNPDPSTVATQPTKGKSSGPSTVSAHPSKGKSSGPSTVAAQATQPEPDTVASQPTQPEPVKSQGPNTVASKPTKGKGPGPSTAATLGIPPGHLPPVGQCRIWIPGTPPGHQAASRSCKGIEKDAAAGTWILYRPTDDKKVVNVRVVDARKPGVVVQVRVYDVQHGTLISES